MNKWQDYFELSAKSWNEIALVVKGTNEVVGVYVDAKYAKKQAKYKFKKITKKVEKALLG